MRDYNCFIESNPRWEVNLNNNEHVVMDCDNINISIRNSWLRLKNYCLMNDLYIVDMIIGFRSNIFSLPSNMDGYFFCKGVRGAFGVPKTMQLFFVGALQNGVLEVSCWKVPEMLKEKTENRNIAENLECLITKNNINLYMER
jgi:hypothetical protein